MSADVLTRALKRRRCRNPQSSVLKMQECDMESLYRIGEFNGTNGTWIEPCV